MSKFVAITEDNKHDVVNVLNLNLVTQPDFHQDFLITDLLLDKVPIVVVTESCSPHQKSDRYNLILKVFDGCNIRVNFTTI